MIAVILMSVDMQPTDKNKFESLYYKYKHILFSQAVGIVKNEADAEDVLQNAFIKIAKNITGIRDIQSKETLSYLIVITKNSAYDFLRKNSRNKGISLNDIDDITALDNSLETIVSKLEYEKIVSVIKNIPSPYNEVLYLHYVKDFSIKKTASLLERKPETVKVQLVRGKKILTEKLSEALYE